MAIARKPPAYPDTSDHCVWRWRTNPNLKWSRVRLIVHRHPSELEVDAWIAVHYPNGLPEYYWKGRVNDNPLKGTRWEHLCYAKPV